MTQLLAFSIGDPGSTNPSLAPIQVGGLPSSINTLVNDNSILPHTLQALFNLLLFFGILLAFVFVVFSGYRYLTSQGEKQAVETARSALINSVVGLIIILSAFVIINILGAFFRVHLLNVSF